MLNNIYVLSSFSHNSFSIFIFCQACRGNLLSDTVTIEMNNTYISSSSSGVALLGLKPVEIPLHKDFFMAFSAPPGEKCIF